jgi:hypothetical protein
MIEKIYYKEDKCTHSAYAVLSKTFDVQYNVK